MDEIGLAVAAEFLREGAVCRVFEEDGLVKVDRVYSDTPGVEEITLFMAARDIQRGEQVVYNLLGPTDDLRV